MLLRPVMRPPALRLDCAGLDQRPDKCVTAFKRLLRPGCGMR